MSDTSKAVMDLLKLFDEMIDDEVETTREKRVVTMQTFMDICVPFMKKNKKLERQIEALETTNQTVTELFDSLTSDYKNSKESVAKEIKESIMIEFNEHRRITGLEKADSDTSKRIMTLEDDDFGFILAQHNDRLLKLENVPVVINVNIEGNFMNSVTTISQQVDELENIFFGT